MSEGTSVPNPNTTGMIENNRVSSRKLRDELLAPCPTTEINIGGKNAHCIIDTGAETSLITSQFYHRHLKCSVGKLGDASAFINLRGANNLEIPVEGYFRTEVVVLGQRIKASFLVTTCQDNDMRQRREAYPILLGCNVLRLVSQNRNCMSRVAVGSDWDLALKWLQSAETSKSSSVKDVSTATGHTGTFDLEVLEPETIPPRSIQAIGCNVVGFPDQAVDTLALLQSHPFCIHCQNSDNFQNELRCDMCYVLEGVQQVDGTPLLLLVVNESDEPLLLSCRAKIATAIPVHCSEEVSVGLTNDGVNVSVSHVVTDTSECDVNQSHPKTVRESGDSLAEDPLGEDGETFVFSDGSEYVLPPGLSLKDLSGKDAEAAARLIQKHSKAFSASPLDLGCCDLIPHEIKLTDNKPVNLPYRRVVPNQMVEIKSLLQDLLNRKIIRRSVSPYASPIVVVRKKNGQLRLCIDYRCLNAKTQKDAFPLPRIDETLESLGGANLFSSLDLTHGYFQVAMHPESVAKTAFRVPWGLYEFLRLPQGLTNSPSTFQRVMELIFGDLNLTEVVLYLDDVLVFSTTFAEHIDRLDKVFTRLEDNGLKLKGSKCKLFQTSVSHLGHVVSSQGISVDPDKVSRIQNWPTPTNAGQLRSFLGLASYYRRYVKNFSSIAAPLHALSVRSQEKAGKAHGPFLWTSEADEAFKVLKQALCEAPVLAFPRFDRDFVLEVDASLRGLGACLSQRDDEGDLHPVAYASRGLRGSEQNYSDLSSFKLELLALKWAVADKFKEYLLGRKTTVYTDNNPVAHIQTAKLGATEQRWVAQLAPFDLEIKYRAGRTNKCADALSRVPAADEIHVLELTSHVTESTSLPADMHVANPDKCLTETKCTGDGGSLPGVPPAVLPSFSFEELATFQKQDDVLAKVWLLWDRRWKPGEELPSPYFMSSEVKGWLKEWHCLVERNGVLYRSIDEQGQGLVYQLLVPKILRASVVEGSHDHWGHQGVDRTLAFMKKRCFWPGMVVHVREHIRNCYHCVVTKGPTPSVRPAMRHLLSFQPLERLAIDFLKLDPGRGKVEDVLIMTDSFTKFAVAVPCKDQKASTVAKVLRDYWFCCYGIPLQLHSDRGRNFEGSIVKELCKLYNIQKTRTTPYHAQGNAQTERFNKTLCGLIKSLNQKNRKQWPDLLPHLVFIYNSTPHSITRFTPYFLMFGRQPTVPLDQLINNTRGNWNEDAVARQAKLLREAHKVAKDRLTRAAAASKRRYDKRAHASPLPVGSRVLLKRCAFTGRHKLSDKYGDHQYIIIERNRDGDLYAIRSSFGGTKRWVNRKMLIIDPRGETVEYNCKDPPLGLPLMSGSDDPDPADSDDSSEWDVLVPTFHGVGRNEPELTAPDGSPPCEESVLERPKKSRGSFADTPCDTVPGPSTGTAADKPEHSTPRRSERIRRRLSTWPNAIT